MNTEIRQKNYVWDISVLRHETNWTLYASELKD